MRIQFCAMLLPPTCFDIGPIEGCKHVVVSEVSQRTLLRAAMNHKAGPRLARAVTRTGLVKLSAIFGTLHCSGISSNGLRCNDGSDRAGCGGAEAAVGAAG